MSHYRHCGPHSLRQPAPFPPQSHPDLLRAAISPLAARLLRPGVPFLLRAAISLHHTNPSLRASAPLSPLTQSGQPQPLMPCRTADEGPQDITDRPLGLDGSPWHHPGACTWWGTASNSQQTHAANLSSKLPSSHRGEHLKPQHKSSNAPGGL